MALPTIPCWLEDDAVAVINPEAEHVPDDVFRAVHTGFSLRLRYGSTASFVSASLTEFRDRFLDPTRKHVQAAVIGASGSGKSHLIQWLRLAIPDSPRRRVINIPKAGTSLRGVVERIIDELPPQHQVEFRDALLASGHSHLSDAGRVDHFLDNLALAIGNDERPEAAVSDRELAEELRACLPAIFRDPHFRQTHFRSARGFVDTLVQHVFSTPGAYARTQERREFAADDLPLGARDRKDASLPARNALDLLLEDGGATAAVALVNRNLDTAITLSLSFAGDRVIELMHRLRAFLHEEGLELILLVEDLARLQGIDYSLLQALIEQAGPSTCVVRWAVAVTDGFYEKLPDTVRTRMSLVVDMDSRSDNHAGDVDVPAVALLAAKYLNAARLGRTQLRGSSRDALTDWRARSRCDDCEFQESCHETFGAEDGYGLFPWTRHALAQMAARAGAITPKGFNPRAFQNSVLLPVLVEHRSALFRGAFPPPALLESLGGVKLLTTGDELTLKASDPNNFERRLALLELWDGSGVLANVRPGIHTAFRLPPLSRLPASEAVREEFPFEERTVGAAELTDPVLGELAKWGRGADISQGTANKLRPLLHSLVLGEVDWDGLGWDRSYFAGHLKSAHISFARQTTMVPSAAVRLSFPHDPGDSAEFARTAFALQGLIQFAARKSWEFKDGARHQASLLEIVASAARRLVGLIQQEVSGAPGWDPALAACELKVIQRHLDGRARNKDTEIDILETSMQEAPASPPNSGELGPLREALDAVRPMLRQVILARIKGVKNGTGGETFIDPTAMLETIHRLRKAHWALVQTPPVVPPRGGGDLQALARTYARVKNEMDSAPARELAWYRQQLSVVGAALDADGDVEEWRAQLEVAAKIAENAAFSVGAQSLRDSLQQLNRSATGELKAARDLLETEPAMSALPLLGRGRRPQLLALLAAVQEAERFLRQFEAAVIAGKHQMTEEQLAAHDAHQDMLLSLQRIEAALSTAEGPPVVADDVGGDDDQPF